MLGYVLEELGLQVAPLHSHLNQRRRLAALHRFKSGGCQEPNCPCSVFPCSLVAHDRVVHQGLDICRRSLGSVCQPSGLSVPLLGALVHTPVCNSA